MTRTRNYTPVVILSFLILMIIIYLFINFKQETITCFSTTTYDDVTVSENLVANFSGNSISSMTLTKKIKVSDKYADTKHINQIVNALEKTLGYLKDVDYSTSSNSVTVTINTTSKDVLLLKNIEFISNDDLEIKIDSNIKSSNVIALKVGDNYSESELMKRMKNNGYSCK